jgi:hypothetical protein
MSNKLKECPQLSPYTALQIIGDEAKGTDRSVSCICGLRIRALACVCVRACARAAICILF